MDQTWRLVRVVLGRVHLSTPRWRPAMVSTTPSARIARCGLSAGVICLAALLIAFLPAAEAHQPAPPLAIAGVVALTTPTPSVTPPPTVTPTPSLVGSSIASCVPSLTADDTNPLIGQVVTFTFSTDCTCPGTNSQVCTFFPYSRDSVVGDGFDLAAVQLGVGATGAIVATATDAGPTDVTVRYYGETYNGDMYHWTYQVSSVTVTIQEPPAIGLHGDVNCDGVVSIIDAFATAQFVVGLRVGVTGCPLASPREQINLDALSSEPRSVTILHASLVAQCVVGLNNRICPAGG